MGNFVICNLQLLIIILICEAERSQCLVSERSLCLISARSHCLVTSDDEAGFLKVPPDNKELRGYCSTEDFTDNKAGVHEVMKACG